MSDVGLKESLPMLAAAACSDPGSNAGIPGIAIPIARTQAGLPIGLGLDGPTGSDRKLLSIGLALEKLFGRLQAP